MSDVGKFGISDVEYNSKKNKDHLVTYRNAGMGEFVIEQGKGQL